MRRISAFRHLKHKYWPRDSGIELKLCDGGLAMIGRNRHSDHGAHFNFPPRGAAMAKTIKITFPESSSIDRMRNIERVRNFAEELSLALGDLGELPMEQADAATTSVVVSKIHKRDLGRCRQLVTRLLEKHLMANEAMLS